MMAAADLRWQHFDDLFGSSDDPWQTRSRFTERAKRKAVLRLLGSGRLGSLLELGCGAGAMTVDLARRCHALSAVDGSREALHRAAGAVAGRANVQLSHVRIPQEFPAGRYDVIVASEILYYLSVRDLRVAVEQIREALAPNGRFISVNHLRHFSDAASTIAQLRTTAQTVLGPPFRRIQIGAWRAEVYGAG
jgi:cyclopropane fatty-acyl-phospholipid synthase-like methyltransferase